jgi:hypothetical protein
LEKCFRFLIIHEIRGEIVTFDIQPCKLLKML